MFELVFRIKSVFGNVVKLMVLTTLILKTSTDKCFSKLFSFLKIFV